MFCSTEGTKDGNEDKDTLSDGCVLGTNVVVGAIEGSALLRAMVDGLLDGDSLGISVTFRIAEGTKEGNEDGLLAALGGTLLVGA